MLRDALCPGQPGRVPSKRKRAPGPLHQGLVPEAPASTDDLGRNFGRMLVSSGVSIFGGCAQEGLGGTEVSDCPLNEWSCGRPPHAAGGFKATHPPAR